jgi:NAD(P)-dependent dehydrogenase (short-subunit alcohol dehydrogenase family)
MAYRLKKIADQVIVVTGASSGIGLATANSAARQGARVVLTARNEPALLEAVQRIRAQGGQAVHVVADVTNAEDLEKVAQTAITEFGGFDTWVNNAGLGIFGRLEEVSDEDSRRLFDVNFWGLVYGTKIAAAHLKTKGGAIINLGSVVSDVAFPIQGMYCASKHAIKGFTDAFRMEMEEAGAPISVTLIKPASINTPFPFHARNYLSQEPKLPPPVYTPDSVADAIVYAAAHGGRDYYIGGGGKIMSTLNKHLPSLVDWVGSRTVRKQSSFDRPPNRPREGALFEAGQDGAVYGDSPHFVMSSAYTKATTDPAVSGMVFAIVGLAGAAALLGRRRRG